MTQYNLDNINHIAQQIDAVTDLQGNRVFFNVEVHESPVYWQTKAFTKGGSVSVVELPKSADVDVDRCMERG